LASDPDFYAGPATIPPEGKVKSVHGVKADFKIELEDGSSATFCLVYRLAYNGDVVRQAPDQLAVFQGASEAPISELIRVERFSFFWNR
jgi:hypothetical protein